MTGGNFAAEGSVPHKRRCRTSKKKRLRLKKRASLEPKVELKNDTSSDTSQDHSTQDKTQNHEANSSVEDKEESKEQQVSTFTHNEGHQQDHQIQNLMSLEEDQHLTLEEDQQTPAQYKYPEEDEQKLNSEAAVGENQKQVQDEMNQYERQRRENILRNQAFMRTVGVSTAKLAARTSVGNEGEKEEKRKELAARRALAAEQKAGILEQPVRKSKRLQREMAIKVMNEVLIWRTAKRSREPDTVRAVETPVRLEKEDGSEMKPLLLRDAGQQGYSSKNVVVMQAVNGKQGLSESQHENVSSMTPEKTSVYQGKHSEVQSQSKESDSDEQEVATDYEHKRRENILRNQMFLNQVDIATAKLAARSAIGNEAAKEAKRQELAAKRALQDSRRAELLQQPKRKSRRLSGEKNAVETGLDYSMDLLSMKSTPHFCSKVNVMDAIGDGKAFCQDIIGDSDKRSAVDKELVLGGAQDDVEYTLTKNDTVKATPYRVTTIAFLPRADRVVVACGDKEGLVSLWSPSNGSSTTTLSSSAVLYRPHGYAVTELIFPSSSTLISSSKDGKVCEFDLWSSKTSLVIDISYEAGITSLAKSDNPQFYYASCNDGTLRLIDRRARNLYSAGFTLHSGMINTVDQHPLLDHCIVTAGQDSKVCFWDKRKIASERNVPIAQLRYRTERRCAQFSPHDGAWLVTLGDEGGISMYDTSSLVKSKASDTPPDIPAPIRIRHNNYTSSSTKFRPAWDPKRPNQFVIGCWGKPSRLEIFRAGQVQSIRELVREKYSTGNFDVVTKYHPYLDLIASGNSVGRLSLWRAKDK